MDTTQQVLRGTDVLRVQAANGPWRGSVSCTNFAHSLQLKLSSRLHHGPRAPSAPLAAGLPQEAPACPLPSRVSRECQPFIRILCSFSAPSGHSSESDVG